MPAKTVVPSFANEYAGYVALNHAPRGAQKYEKQTFRVNFLYGKKHNKPKQ